MDTFLNLAKQGYEVYQESQSHENVSKTGGHEYNSPDNADPSNHSDRPNINHGEASRLAEQQGQGSGSSELFNHALNFMSQHKQQHTDPVDEDAVTSAHQQAYEGGDPSGLSAHAMGGAAALQALKQFTSGGGGSSQTELISFAMAEASKLFDQAGGASSGNKQDAVNGAAMTVMKLLVQSKFSGAIGGGNSGGLGSLMGLAKQFM
ncbi:hypothetical protein CPB84DRAFT_1739619 [Gymnopilus junonius]|uniref:DUF7721 domain-containing protein n=1 Tax=Gymnopilus junonius TaxID=109634 RepID=A0A9P5N6N1_GYMJU|nr:hypothetical protein CPB84DRAFT_1739619 [Gymnopilus junonius]